MTTNDEHNHHSHEHGHGHGHGSNDDFDWAAMAVVLEREAELERQLLADAPAWLRGLLGAPAYRVLDVGSGPGVMTCALADAFPGARVTAVDGSPQLLERAGARAERLGQGGRVTTHHADLPEDWDTLGTADVIWTSRAVHHLGDQQAALTALAGRLRPGGLLAVAEGGLPRRFLPRDIGIGRPGLQSRLDAAVEGWFTEMRAGLPGHVGVAEDWPAMLTAAGLTHTGTRTFLADIPAPAPTVVREALRTHLARLREKVDDLEGDDLAVLDRLLAPDAPESIDVRPDVFYLSATTVHTARLEPEQP